MVAKISSNAAVSVSIEPARSRQTAENDFGSMVERGARRVGGAVAGGMRVIAPLVPGGGAVNAVADIIDVAAGVQGSGSSQMDLLRAQERLQEEGLSNSLRLLELQRQIQKESETFSLISNVSKSRHEMAKKAINNIS